MLNKPCLVSYLEVFEYKIMYVFRNEFLSVLLVHIHIPLTIITIKAL